MSGGRNTSERKKSGKRQRRRRETKNGRTINAARTLRFIKPPLPLRTTQPRAKSSDWRNDVPDSSKITKSSRSGGLKKLVSSQSQLNFGKAARRLQSRRRQWLQRASLFRMRRHKMSLQNSLSSLNHLLKLSLRWWSPSFLLLPRKRSPSFLFLARRTILIRTRRSHELTLRSLSPTSRSPKVRKSSLRNRPRCK